MAEWWNSLAAINQWFYLGAFFFSVFFIWQLVSSLLGLSGAEHSVDITSHVDMTVDHTQLDPTANAAAHETLSAFKLISIRSVLAFFTLFFWAAAMYLNIGRALPTALLYGFLWGTSAMLVVAGLFYLLMRMTQTGNLRLESSAGSEGTVYLDIPAGGVGEVRVMVSGVLQHVRARNAGQGPLKAGQKVKVTKIIDAVTVEVAPESS